MSKQEYEIGTFFGVAFPISNVTLYIVMGLIIIAGIGAVSIIEQILSNFLTILAVFCAFCIVLGGIGELFSFFSGRKKIEKFCQGTYPADVCRNMVNGLRSRSFKSMVKILILAVVAMVAAAAAYFLFKYILS